MFLTSRFIQTLFSKGLRILILATLLLGVCAQPVSAQVDVPETDEATTIDPDLEAAVLTAVGARGGQWQYFNWVIDHVVYDAGELQALVWLAAVDGETGIVLGREPNTVIAMRTSLDAAWQVIFDDDEPFSKSLDMFQGEIYGELKPETTFIEKGIRMQHVFGGYYLPWQAGLTKTLTWSITHTSCANNACYYAFDFADGSMFPISAIKGGTVFHFKDTCANGDATCTNSITLEDRSTTPWTYQIYLHIANNSVPAELRTIGAPVYQGQHIANVDDTGYSTAHHLHLMVVTEDTMYTSASGYIWGVSEDITFRDVTINWDAATQGGRPRRVDEAQQLGGEGQNTYVSGNVGNQPPTGGFFDPESFQEITNPILLVSGWGLDNDGIAAIRPIINYDGSWQEVGSQQTGNLYSATLNLCNEGIPDGPFALALRIWDGQGNVADVDVRHLIKDTTCAPPAAPVCSPGVNQVAVFSEANYQGYCKVLDIGNYPTAAYFSPPGDDSIASVKLGGSVQVAFFDGQGYTGRQLTLTESDRNLVDNRVAAKRISSIIVRARNVIPETPTLSAVTGATGGTPTAADSLTLAWTGGAGATRFQAEAYQGSSISGAFYKKCYFSVNMFCSVGSLPAGTYTWRVQGRVSVLKANGSYESYFSDWAVASFTVTSGSLPNTVTLNAPFTETFESTPNGWAASGLWQWVVDPANASNHLWAFNSGSAYASGNTRAGSLTSPVIQAPSAGNLFLTFNYRHQTEDAAAYWDQRRVQISVNGGAFTDLIMLYDDAPLTALSSGYIDLSAYINQQFRLRFYFNTIDDQYNSGQGWLIDNIQLGITPQPVNNENPSNDTIATAQALTSGVTVAEKINRAADVDFYKIYASAGQTIIVDVNTALGGSTPVWDSLASLYFQFDNYIEADQPVIAENDNRSPASLDPYLRFTVPETGWYFIRIKAAQHPGVGGSNYNYNLTATLQNAYTGADATEPAHALLYPASNTSIVGLLTLDAFANDGAGSGVDRVNFYYHASDWENGRWQLIGTDYLAADGWQMNFDLSAHPGESPFAFLMEAIDRAGNKALAAAWNVGTDSTPPTLDLTPLPASWQSTAIHLTWNASDAHSGVSHYTVEKSISGGAWTAIGSNLPASTTELWHVAAFNQTLSFRVTAYDQVGNSAALTTNTITSSTCTSDAQENDDTFATAKAIAPGDSKNYNFCWATVEEDWLSFNATAGQHYLFVFAPLGEHSPIGLQITLYNSSQVQLATESAAGFGEPLSFSWTAPASGVYKIKMLPITTGVGGALAQYSVSFSSAQILFLPLVTR